MQKLKHIPEPKQKNDNLENRDIITGRKLRKRIINKKKLSAFELDEWMEAEK